MYMYKFYVNAFGKKHHYVSRENKCFYEIIKAYNLCGDTELIA